MARNDDQQRGSGTPSRVYKSSDVHRRRVDRKGRAKESVDIAVSSASPEEATASEQPADEVKPAVVISPEFGRRADAQRQADDRWFAAMRDSDLVEERWDSADRPKAVVKPEADGLQADDGLQASPSPAEAPQASPSPARVPQEPMREQMGEESSEGEPADVPLKPKRPSAMRRLLDHLPKKRPLRIAIIAVAIVIIVGIVASLLFTWNRWYRFDDHADMQGTWYAAGTIVPIEIDEASIKLTDDVTYRYEIDTHDKTIHYVFGPMEGQGRYWFSDDRQYLVITDGSDFDGTSTALDDLLHSFTDMGDKVTGAGMRLPEGEGIIAFSRKPDSWVLTSLTAESVVTSAKAEAEKVEEAKRKAAEEAAEEEYYYYEEEYYEEEAPADDSSSDGESEEEPADEEQYDEEG